MRIETSLPNIKRVQIASNNINVQRAELQALCQTQFRSDVQFEITNLNNNPILLLGLGSGDSRAFHLRPLESRERRERVVRAETFNVILMAIYGDILNVYLYRSEWVG